MFAIFVGLLLLAAALLWLYERQMHGYWQRRGVPFEAPHFLYGNLQGVGRQLHFRDVNQRIYRRFRGTAPLAGMYFYAAPLALVLDLDAIKHVLIKDFANFPDRGIFFNERDDPLSAHLFALEGEQWRAMRNKLSPVFTSGKMKFMFPVVVAVADRLNECCAALLKSESAERVLELKELCARYSTDVIGTVAFGLECNSLADPEAEFRRHGRNILENPRHPQWVVNLMLSNPRLARRLRMKFFRDETTDFFVGAVRSTVEHRQQQHVRRNDFMDLLIELLAKDQQQAAACNDGIELSQGLTLQQLAAQAFVFFIAGFDTSSSTMSFCLYELALNQNVQDRLRAEIGRVLKAHGGVLTYEAMGEMYYLDQVVAETLRKYPPVLDLMRQTLDEYRIPDTNITLERGVRVFIPVYAIHHDPELYVDPERFDPDRFTPEAIMARHSCAYLPFGDGPRNCIGLRFGKMQAKVGLIRLLQDYKFSRCEKTEMPLEFCKRNFMLTAKNGIYLRVERIERSL